MKARELKEITNTFNQAVNRGRGLGNTTALIKLLKENDKAILIVHSESFANNLKRNRPELKNRIVRYTDTKYWLGRSDVFPVFDNFALQSIFAETNAKLQLLEDTVKTLKNLENEL